MAKWIKVTNVDPGEGVVREIPVNMDLVLTYVETNAEQQIQFLGGMTILYPAGTALTNLIVRETVEDINKLMEQAE